MKVNLPAIRRPQKAEFTGRIEQDNRPDGSVFVMFHLALNAAYLILKLTAGMPEGIVDGECQIGVPFIRPRCPSHIDFAPVRQRETNMHVVKPAKTMMMTWALYRDPASDYTTPPLLQLADVLGNRLLNLRRAADVLKLDLRCYLQLSSPL